MKNQLKFTVTIIDNKETQAYYKLLFNDQLFDIGTAVISMNDGAEVTRRAFEPLGNGHDGLSRALEFAKKQADELKKCIKK